MTEDITWLFPTDTHLGSIDEELHVQAIVCDCHMCPLVGHVTNIRVDGSRFVSTVSFKGEKESRVTVSMFTNRLDTKQPTSVTGGVEAFVVQTWG